MDVAGFSTVFLEFMFTLQRSLVDVAFSASRATGFVLILPMFTRIDFPILLRGALALGLALPIHTQIGGELRTEVFESVLPLVILSIKEILVGAVLGVIIGFPIYVARAAGEIVDLLREASQPDIPEGQGDQATVTGALFAFLAVMIFLEADGIQTIAETIYGSYRIWPVTTYLPTFTLAAQGYVLAILGELLRLGLLLASAFVVLFLVVLVCFAGFSKIAPNMVDTMLGTLFKNMLFPILLMLYAGIFMDEIAGIMVPSWEALAILEGFLGDG